MGWPGPVTHRQFRTWREFDDESRNHPTTTQHYLMALRADVYRAQGVKADSDKMRLTWGPPTPPVNPAWVLTKDRIAEMNRTIAHHKAAGGFVKDKSKAAVGPPVVKDASAFLPPGAVPSKGIRPVLKR